MHEKAFFFFATFCFLLQSFGQDSTLLATQNTYLQKSQKQKKTANILLAIGGGLMLTAFIIPRGEKIQEGYCVLGWCISDKYKNDGVKGVVGTIGGLTVISSIPFFRASSKNKKRATQITGLLQLVRAPVVHSAGRTTQVFPALALRLQWP